MALVFIIIIIIIIILYLEANQDNKQVIKLSFEVFLCIVKIQFLSFILDHISFLLEELEGDLYLYVLTSVGVP